MAHKHPSPHAAAGARPGVPVSWILLIVLLLALGAMKLLA